MNVHVCEDHDYEQFYTPFDNETLEEYEINKENSRYLCMDHEDTEGNPVNLNVQASDWHNSRYFSIIYRPCLPELETQENKNDTTKCLVKDESPETHRKKYEDSIEYVKGVKLQLLMNHELIESSDHSAIKKSSRISNYYFAAESPSYSEGQFRFDKLVDLHLFAKSKMETWYYGVELENFTHKSVYTYESYREKIKFHSFDL